MRAAILAVLTLAQVLSGCVDTDARARRRAEYDQKALAQGQTAKTVTTEAGTFKVEGSLYHPALFPFESFVKQLAQGNFSKAIDGFDWRYVPTNVDSSLIEELLYAGYLPAIVKVTNTGKAPANMQALLLKASLGNDKGVAVPNDELPNAFSKIDWKNVGGNVAGAVVNTAVIVGVVALFYVAAKESGNSRMNNLAFDLMPNVKLTDNVQVGAGRGVLCPHGVPVPYDGVPFTNEQAQAFASACWKQQMAVKLPGAKMDRPITKVTDLDYGNVLLQYRLLAPGESVTGIQFFKMPNGIADWQAGALHAELPPGAGQTDLARVQHSQATVVDAGFFKGEKGVKVGLDAMPVASCRVDDDGDRYTLTFRDTYGDEVLSQKLEVVFDAKDYPKPNTEYVFDGNNSNQRVTLFLGADLGQLNGEWRSYVSAGKSSRCRLTTKDAQRTSRTGRLVAGDTLAFHDEFYLTGTLDCERTADWNVGTTQSWLKFKAAFACRHRYEEPRLKTATGPSTGRQVNGRDRGL